MKHPNQCLIRSKRNTDAAPKSLLNEAYQTQLAIGLIGHGARMQVLEAETTLSRDRLIRLYKELRGESPSKGMLPFSEDWFLTWRPNIHSSLFYAFYRFLLDTAKKDRVEAMTSAYELYLEHVSSTDDEVVLTFTRAWTLLRFAECDVLDTCRCTCCGGHYIVHAYSLKSHFVCGICRPPSRAGKRRSARVVDSPKDQGWEVCLKPGVSYSGMAAGELLEMTG
ncbi:Flagellar transcriptional activator FlhC [Paraburkholderia caribensis MBA4]|uniref:Flagellar transcriptional regulator FlhC n=1 Tax=Paraburkholderia caribensis MBA4 TaxID=1323664 RepID=A0A0N7JVD8_9BURK|nr:flagellar transcriptional regulator FlhC [Paraburkholderia caribensis]ALL68933.1 Flagellar transcriptional activator FlhC [Paraburkholderia caribensis MBA4]